MRETLISAASGAVESYRGLIRLQYPNDNQVGPHRRLGLFSRLRHHNFHLRPSPERFVAKLRAAETDEQAIVLAQERMRRFPWKNHSYNRYFWQMLAESEFASQFIECHPQYVGLYSGLVWRGSDRGHLEVFERGEQQVRASGDIEDYTYDQAARSVGISTTTDYRVAHRFALNSFVPSHVAIHTSVSIHAVRGRVFLIDADGLDLIDFNATEAARTGGRLSATKRHTEQKVIGNIPPDLYLLALDTRDGRIYVNRAARNQVARDALMPFDGTENVAGVLAYVARQAPRHSHALTVPGTLELERLESDVVSATTAPVENAPQL